MFDDMVTKQLCSDGKDADIIKPLLKKLLNRPLKVATMCSGTESPVLALDMIAKAIEEFFHTHMKKDSDEKELGMLQIEHVFSCEIEPFKQAYIERNFQPPLLFRDIRELGKRQAHTAYGSLVDVPNTPGCVDMLIAGTSCVDYSNLNNEKVRIAKPAMWFEIGTSAPASYSCLTLLACYRIFVIAPSSESHRGNRRKWTNISRNDGLDQEITTTTSYS